jgi:small subunit ribosomal protein S6
MNKYELALVISAKLDDETRAAVLEKALGYITRQNATIGEIEEWGKKRLAYEIQKEHDGFYYFIPFEAESTAPAEIERHVRIMDHVLRYLIVRQDEK